MRAGAYGCVCWVRVVLGSAFAVRAPHSRASVAQARCARVDTRPRGRFLARQAVQDTETAHDSDFAPPDNRSPRGRAPNARRTDDHPCGLEPVNGHGRGHGRRHGCVNDTPRDSGHAKCLGQGGRHLQPGPAVRGLHRALPHGRRLPRGARVPRHRHARSRRGPARLRHLPVRPASPPS